jgi:hypothetical protein
MADGIAEIRKLFHNAMPLQHPPGRARTLSRMPRRPRFCFTREQMNCWQVRLARPQPDLPGCGWEIPRQVSR